MDDPKFERFKNSPEAKELESYIHHNLRIIRDKVADSAELLVRSGVFNDMSGPEAVLRFAELIRVADAELAAERLVKKN
jgi:hypothetical protein